MLRIGRRKRQGLCPSADISSNDLRFGGLVMSMNSIAVLTSGGDAPGMNAAVRAVAERPSRMESGSSAYAEAITA